MAIFTKELFWEGLVYVGGPILARKVLGMDLERGADGKPKIKPIESRAGGIGAADEVLAADAFVLAGLEIMKMNSGAGDPTRMDRLIAITKYINSLSRWQKNALKKKLGFKEDEFIEVTPVFIKNDKGEEKESKKELKTLANIKGSRLLLHLTTMELEDAKTFINSLGLLNNPVDDIMAVISKIDGWAEFLAYKIDPSLAPSDPPVPLAPLSTDPDQIPPAPALVPEKKPSPWDRSAWPRWKKILLP